jgi:hypothetical protein
MTTSALALVMTACGATPDPEENRTTTGPAAAFAGLGAQSDGPAAEHGTIPAGAPRPAPLADKTWVGSGGWSTATYTGSYDVTISRRGNDVESRYAYPFGEATYKTRWVFAADGSFDLYFVGVDQPIGRGACSATTCQYAAPSINDIKEVWEFEPQGLHRHGSYTANGVLVTWEDRLR